MWQGLLNRIAAALVALRRERRAAVAVMFAAASLPMVAMVGLAVDYGAYSQVNAELNMASNMAAMIAAKMTANAQAVNDTNAVTEGQNGGKAWFLAIIGSPSQSIISPTPVTLASGSPSVVVSISGTTVTAVATYSATVTPIFGGMFGRQTYWVSGGATSQVTMAPFLDVEILLDNSGSMQIGATDSDIVHLQEITPCTLAKTGSPSPGAVYTGAYLGQDLGGQPFNAYQTTGYDGDIAVPAAAVSPLTYTSFTPTRAVSQPGPSCQGALPAQSNGSYPTAGPPCAFACHFDTSTTAGAGNDFYALARATIGTSNPITLRFDLVKAATNQVIAALQTANNTSLNNLQVGVFAFNSSLTAVYPASGCSVGTLACAAGNSWSTAESDVGAPPTSANGPDTGIQTFAGTNANLGGTDLHASMTTLLTYMTQAGAGTSSASPRKVLFLVTDGLVDTGSNSTRAFGGVSSTDCDSFKNLGFTIYVLFIPYYPVMNGYYVSTIMPLVEPTATSTVAEALEACATAPSDYISASSATAINAALQSFLKSALLQPARFTN